MSQALSSAPLVNPKLRLVTMLAHAQLCIQASPIIVQLTSDCAGMVVSFEAVHLVNLGLQVRRHVVGKQFLEKSPATGDVLLPNILIPNIRG